MTSKSIVVLYFFRTSAIYLLVAVGLVITVRDDVSAIPVQILQSVRGMSQALSHPVTFIAVIALCLLPLRRTALRVSALGDVLLAVAGYALFFSAFFLVKTALPLLAEAAWGHRFIADVALMRLDRFLHFGIDPWIATHWVSDQINWSGLPRLYDFLYTTLWLALSMLFPVFLALWDQNRERQLRYMQLYMFSWIILGNVLPFVFLAAGPIYLDRVHGLADFIPLANALAGDGMAQTSIVWQQDWLWSMYTANEQGVGSGISAFPSGHLALATTLAIYAHERMPRLLPVALGFLAVTQFLSVHSGYHYAVDGYFSIAAVWYIHRLLLVSSNAKSSSIVWS